jgi:hypothetical protein
MAQIDGVQGQITDHPARLNRVTPSARIDTILRISDALVDIKRACRAGGLGSDLGDGRGQAKAVWPYAVWPHSVWHLFRRETRLKICQFCGARRL